MSDQSYYFTKQAQQVIAQAEVIAELRGDNTVEPVHTLLAILKEQAGLGYAVLEKQGLTYEAANAALSEISVDEQAVIMDDALSTLYGFALADAMRRGQTAVDTEHLLTALVAQKHADVMMVLQQANLTKQQILAELDQLIAAMPRPAETQKPSSSGSKNKMERFTQRARRVLSLAQEAAEGMGHATIMPEHLLLALITEEEGVAHEVLKKQGMDKASLEQQIKQIFPPDDVLRRNPILADETKKVLELSVETARRFGHHYIGTEHLLGGMMRLGKAEINTILAHFNTDADTIIASTTTLLKPQSGNEE